MVGTYSYAIYLFHTDFALVPVVLLNDHLHHLPGSVQCVVSMSAYLSLAVASGALMSWLIEKPFLMWRDRILPARAKLPFVGQSLEESRRCPEHSSRNQRHRKTNVKEPFVCRMRLCG